ncbi:MAG: hypothetical protein JO036_12070 [Candidatus Eremiobacteraeota bacterium]|nr:hypothetical protein [Candidatus Eremiobacteraeota bacterium]
MTVFNTEPDVERELSRFGRVLGRASVFLLVNLAAIVDMTTLREGDGEDDYLIDVPANRLSEVRQPIAELHEEVRRRFGIDVTVRVMPVAD